MKLSDIACEVISPAVVKARPAITTGRNGSSVRESPTADTPNPAATVARRPIRTATREAIVVVTSPTR